MSGLPALGADALESLAEFVGRLKHDLGKYINFQMRWLGPEADTPQRLAALRADLLQTRRGPSGTVDALSVWREFRPVLHGERAVPGGDAVDLSEVDEVAQLGAAMGELVPVVAALREGSASEETLLAGTASATLVSEACRALQRRVRRAMIEP